MRSGLWHRLQHVLAEKISDIQVLLKQRNELWDIQAEAERYSTLQLQRLPAKRIQAVAASQEKYKENKKVQSMNAGHFVDM